jgi:hypothetical protein
MGGGVHPTKCMACVLKKDEKLVEVIRASKATYAKPLKVA